VEAVQRGRLILSGYNAIATQRKRLSQCMSEPPN